LFSEIARKNGTIQTERCDGISRTYSVNSKMVEKMSDIVWAINPGI
jgi:hypothetical protein